MENIVKNRKKVVFVNPPELIRGVVMETLTGKDFEVYQMLDYHKIDSVVEKYPDTIFFLNLDASMPLYEWETYIKDIRKKFPFLNLGVLSFNRNLNQDIVDRFLFNLDINCGFIQMKHSVHEVLQILLKVLYANEAKKEKTFIRYNLPDHCRNSITLHLEGKQFHGKVRDISPMGFSCFFNTSLSVKKYELLRNIQFIINGMVINCNAILIGIMNVGEQDVYLFVFYMNQDNGSEYKQKIQKFIYNALQVEFDKEFGLHQHASRMNQLYHIAGVSESYMKQGRGI